MKNPMKSDKALSALKHASVDIVTDCFQYITQCNSINSFITVRLFGEKIMPQDFGYLVQMHNNPKMMATLGGLRSEEQTHEYLDTNLKHWNDHGFGLWMFYLKQTKAWVGRGGLRHVYVGGHDEVEVAYGVMPAFWNQGLATEITHACIEIAFKILCQDSIVCFTLTTNLASQKVMEKAGFQYERSIEYANLPHVLYRLTKSDFLKRGEA